MHFMRQNIYASSFEEQGRVESGGRVKSLLERRVTQPWGYMLYCTVLHFTVLYCTVLYCIVLYCTVLYCTVLYCTVLYWTGLCRNLANKQQRPGRNEVSQFRDVRCSAVHYSTLNCTTLRSVWFEVKKLHWQRP